MWSNAVIVIAVLGTTLAASIHHPSEELCEEQQIETSTFEFLEKCSQKQIRGIVKLTMVNASIYKVDPRLKYMKNLNYLDLSHNNVQIPTIAVLHNLKTLILKANSLKNINMTALPPNIEVLDISHNLLTHVPKDWGSLKSLKTLNLYKNPIDCDCSNRNVLDYERLVRTGIAVPGSVTCQSPPKFQGKDISTVSCPLADAMLDDEPAVEGSGSIDIFESTEGTNVPLIEEEVEDEGVVLNNTLIDDRDQILDVATTSPAEDTTVEEEGSGEEGSGFVMVECLENCTTPEPLGANDGKFDSQPPPLRKQFQIVFEDLFHNEADSTTSSTTATTTTQATSPISTSTTMKEASKAPRLRLPAREPEIQKETEPALEKSADKGDIETFLNTTDTSELGKASMAPKDSTAVYAIVGVGLFLGVLFLIAFFKKRNTKRRQNPHDAPNANGEEMECLKKQPVTVVNEKPNRKSNIPESVPLIQGQNGTPKDDYPKLTSFTPLAHPELPRNGLSNDEDPVKENGHLDEADEVDLRPKTQPELLTPQRERVTIRESEIPDSIPKTPLLVHRQKNSDGEIIMVVP